MATGEQQSQPVERMAIHLEGLHSVTKWRPGRDRTRPSRQRADRAPRARRQDRGSDSTRHQSNERAAETVTHSVASGVYATERRNPRGRPGPTETTGEQQPAEPGPPNAPPPPERNAHGKHMPGRHFIGTSSRSGATRNAWAGRAGSPTKLGEPECKPAGGTAAVHKRTRPNALDSQSSQIGRTGPSSEK